MSLTERRHLGRQEEDVSESGVQVRSNEPTTPVENQTWINKVQNKLKVYSAGVKITLAEGGIGAAIEIPISGLLDANESRSFFKEVSDNFEVVDFINFQEGLIAYLRLDNPNNNLPEITEITLPAPTSFANGSYFLINSANNEDEYYVWANFDSTGVDPSVVGRTGVEIDTSIGLTEITEVTTVGGAGITSGQHWLLYSANNAVEYYVWYNVNGAGGDPLIGGKTGIQVGILSSDSAAAVALKTADVINALADFSASDSGNVVTVETTAVGSVTDASNVSVPGLTINVTQDGKPADTVNQFTVKVAAALDALAGFSVPVPVGAVIEVTNADDGFTDDAVDGNMGVAVDVTQQGEGKIFVTFPATGLVDELTPAEVDGQKSQLYKLFRNGPFVYIIDQGTYDL